MTFVLCNKVFHKLLERSQIVQGHDLTAHRDESRSRSALCESADRATRAVHLGRRGDAPGKTPSQVTESPRAQSGMSMCARAGGGIPHTARWRPLRCLTRIVRMLILKLCGNGKKHALDRHRSFRRARRVACRGLVKQSASLFDSSGTLPQQTFRNPKRRSRNPLRAWWSRL